MNVAHQDRKFVIRRLNKSCYERQDGVHPARSPLHSFFYLTEGSVLVDIEDATYFIQEDDLVIIPSGKSFKVRYYENSKGYMGGFHDSLIDIVAAEGVVNMFDFLRIWGNPKIVLDSRSSASIALLLERLAVESEEREPNREIVKAYLMAFLVEADLIYKKVNARISRHNDVTCNKFLELLFHRKEEGERIDVASLSVTYFAGQLNITPNHLNKVVKSVTGKSPSVWIEELVIQEAKRLLRTTSLPLGEVAASVGMHDQSYFARRFKRHEGISPREYRARGYKGI